MTVYSIKVAVFGDDENTTFKDNREFKGSIFKQIDEAFRYIMLSNCTSSVFKGLERIDKSDYPEAALREALLNSVVHRDYSYSGSIIININNKQMEFVSIGGLLPGLTADDIRSGISQPRNKNLAEVFHRLKLIESYGNAEDNNSTYFVCKAELDGSNMEYITKMQNTYVNTTLNLISTFEDCLYISFPYSGIESEFIKTN